MPYNYGHTRGGEGKDEEALRGGCNHSVRRGARARCGRARDLRDRLIAWFRGVV